MSTKSKITLIPFSLLLLATLPIFILSFLNSIIVLSTVKFSTKNIKDKQFLSSFRFGLGVVLFPLVFILQAAIMALLLKNFWYALAYFAVSPITVILFFEWKRLAMLVLNRFNEIRFKLFKSSKIIRPIELFKSINNQMWKVVNLSKEETYDFS